MSTLPATEFRTLPQNLYGALDIRASANGGVEIDVPMSPGASAHSWIYYSPFWVIAGVPLTFFVLLGSQVQPTLEVRAIMAVVFYFILRFMLWGVLYLYAIVTEERFLQLLEVRPDGLTINGEQFFSRAHLHGWYWWRKPKNDDPNDDSWYYTFEIDYGVRKIVVWDDIDEPAAQFLSKRFEDITRRVWAREN